MTTDAPTFALDMPLKSFRAPDTSKWDVTPAQAEKITADRREHFDVYEHGHYDSFLTVIVEGSNNSAGWGLCGWNKEGTGRLVFQGPMVRGPHASLFGLASVICSNTDMNTGAVNARAEKAGKLIRCKAGDTIKINDDTFVVSLCRRGYPKLTIV